MVSSYFKRRIGSFIRISMLMLASVCYAADTYKDSNGVVWDYEEIEGGCLAILGCDFSTIESKVLIPSHINGNKVTDISGFAFAYCVDLEEIVIPSGIEYIGIGAFCGCSSLKSVALPDTLTTIQGMAFMDCTALSKIELPEGLKYIFEKPFGVVRG